MDTNIPAFYALCLYTPGKVIYVPSNPESNDVTAPQVNLVFISELHCISIVAFRSLPCVLTPIYATSKDCWASRVMEVP